MPPKTVVPTEWRPFSPAPRGDDQRNDAHDEGQRRHEDGTQTDAGRFHRGVKNGHAALAELLGEFDDQDGVLGGEADEHDESDLAVDVVLLTRESTARRARRAGPWERRAG